MDQSSSNERPKRNTSIRDYSQLFTKHNYPQKRKLAMRNPKNEPITTQEGTIKEEPVVDIDSTAPMSIDTKVKQEPEEESPVKAEDDTSSIPEAIVKDELIIEDTLDPLQGEQEDPKLDESTEPGLNRSKLKNNTREVQEETYQRRCPLCNYGMNKLHEYSRHMAQHRDKGSGLWRCLSCWKLYKGRMNLKKHYLTEVCAKKKEEQLKSPKAKKPRISSNVLTCAECNRTFSKRRVYEVHVKFDHEPKGVQDRTKRNSCEICGLLVRHQKPFIKHMQSHQEQHGSILPTGTPENMIQDVDGLFQCSECIEKLPTPGSYIAHYKRHMFIKQLGIKCTHCGEYFQYKYQLRIHLAEHKKKEKDKKLKQRTSEDPDAKIKAIEEKNGSFSCSACKAMFPNQKYCNRHIMNQHGTNFRCETCGKFWQTEAKLRTHEKRHETRLAKSMVIETNENGLFMCYECPAVFLLRGACQNHIWVQHKRKQTLSVGIAEPSEYNAAKDRGFQCMKCGKILLHKHSLKVHLRLHERQRKISDGVYKCTECEKQFSSKSSYNLHVSWHSRKKSKSFFKCMICNMTFSTQQGVLRHKLTKHQGSDMEQETISVHQALGRFNCPECSSTFGSVYNMHRHVRKYHH